MPAMQPYSGGPHSRQKYLRLQIKWIKNDLENKPMDSWEKKRTENILRTLQTELKTLNAKIREMKKQNSVKALLQS